MHQLRILAALAVAIPAVLQSQAPIATHAKAACAVRTGPVTPAEAALAREDYPVALDLYQKMAPADPVASRAGVIRVLIEQSKVADAEAMANEWIAREPKSGDALVSLAEIQYRKGLLSEAYATAAVARSVDPCLARADLFLAAFESLSGYHAKSKSHIDLSHRLDPIDPEIRRFWIETLSRQRRIEELNAVLGQPDLIGARDAKELPREIESLKASRPDDCSLAKPIESGKIPIRGIVGRPHELMEVALDADLNGKRRRFGFDTGASGLLLTRSAAARLGLIREQQVEIEGIGDQGEVASSMARVDSLRIGDVEFHHCAITILEKEVPMEFDGLIGGDLFSKFLLTIDYPNSEIRLEPLPKRADDATAKPAASTLQATSASRPTTTSEENDEAAETKEPVFHDPYIAPEMKNWTRCYRTGQDLLLPVQIGSSTGKLFIVDTGANTIVISPAAAREVTKVHIDSKLHLSGISGEVNQVFATGRFPLIFANLQQNVDTMTAIDLTKISHDIGVEVSGLLGAPILRRLTIHIDYRDNLIKFDYDPKNDNSLREY